DVLRSAWLDFGRQGAQPLHVALVSIGGARGERRYALAVLRRAHHDTIVDIGDVAHVGDARVAALEQPIEHIECHDRPRIADMHVVVDGRPADIHAHMALVERYEWFLLTRQRVVDDEGHGPYSPNPSLYEVESSAGTDETSVTSRRSRAGE